ncbi:MAG: PIN domain-containing protein [Microbacterium sp.]
MTRYLLDANVLIALTIAEHTHFDRASAWFANVDEASLCPVVEGALTRNLVRVGVPTVTISSMLRALHVDRRIESWPDDLSYADVDLSHIVGHRQVTDTYLAALAAHHGGQLATLDEALHRALPDATFLVPAYTTCSG